MRKKPAVTRTLGVLPAHVSKTRPANSKTQRYLTGVQLILGKTSVLYA